MVRTIKTRISYALYKKILDEKEKLINLEKKKPESKRRQINLSQASLVLCNKLKK